MRLLLLLPLFASTLCAQLVSGTIASGSFGGAGATSAPPAAAESLTNDVIAYWAFEGDGATWLDSSTNGRTLTEVGTALTTNAGWVGHAGHWPNNAGNYLERADENAFSVLGDSLSFACWVNFDTTNARQTILAKDYVNNGTREYSIFLPNTTNGLYLAVFTNASAAGSAVVTNRIAPGSWYFVCAIIDYTNQVGKIRVGSTNGPSASLGSWATTPTLVWTPTLGTNTTTTFKLGRLAGSGVEYPLDGRLDEVMVKRGVFSDEQVTNLWNNGEGRAWPLE